MIHSCIRSAVRSSSYVALLIVCLLTLVSLSPAAFAAKVAGVSLDEKISIENTELVLNGAGMRKKLFIKLYVGSLYLLEKNSDADAVMQADQPMLIRLNVLSQLLTREKLIKAINDGFEKSVGDNLASLQPDIDRFLKIVSVSIEPGDQVSIFYQPESGTAVLKNEELLGTIAGLEFKQALFGLWLSAKPVQASLKKAMIAAR